MEPAEALAQHLQRLHELLAELVYRVDVLGLAMAAGRTRWIDRLSEEVRVLVDTIGGVDAERARAAQALAARAGLLPTATLSDLLGHVPQPWGQILAHHRQNLRAVKAELDEVSQGTSERARHGLRRTRDLMASLGEPAVDLYEPTGRTALTISGPVRLDRTV